MSRITLVFCFICAIIGILWYEYRALDASSPKTGEVVTFPYSTLNQEDTLKLDKLHTGYDPRRAGVSIIDYAKSRNNGDIPLSWSDLVETENKTELGLFWLHQYPIEQVILMKNHLHPYKVKFNTPLPLLESIRSLSSSVNSFFKEEKADNLTYDAVPLLIEDFDLNFSTNLLTLSPEQQKHFDPDIEEYRYFKEGSLLNVSGLAHYDLRFFHSRIIPMDRVSILHRIVRAWTRFTTKAQMKTWIAHGSLLGYYFNGLIMPWDDDLDVQMTSESFWKLVKFNGTLVIDYEDEVNLGKYLIDINPWFLKRQRNPENKIDARFIDVESGLYIDITVLTSELTQDDLVESLDDEEQLEFYKVFNPYYDQILTETEHLSLEIERSINKSIEVKELISCKDYHFYTVQELSPLIPTIFEGDIVYIPNNIPNMLIREYGRRSLYLQEFKGFKFDRFQNLWVHAEMQYETNPLLLKFAQDHRSIKQTTFKRHRFDDDNLVKYPTLRVEPWIRDST